jgi:hypothetical protein
MFPFPYPSCTSVFRSNRNLRELLAAWVEHVELNGATQIEETATQLAADWETQLPSNWASQSSVIHLFLLMARKVDEAANFVFVQLIE